MKEHVWIRRSAVIKALRGGSDNKGSSFKSTITTSSTASTYSTTTTTTDYDWVRAILLPNNNSTNDTTSITLQVDDDDYDDDDFCLEYNGKVVDLPMATTVVLPTNEWTDATIAAATDDDNVNDNDDDDDDACSTSVVHHPPDDLRSLTHLHEPAVVYCLQRRFVHDNQIYTNVSNNFMLLAINPLRDHVKNLYSQPTMARYWAVGEGLDIHVTHEGSSRTDTTTDSPETNTTTRRLPPHVYSSAHSAYRTMMNSLESTSTTTTSASSSTAGGRVCKDQSILVSGESGSGKTVSTKHVMKYLANVSLHRAQHQRGCLLPDDNRSSRRSTTMSTTTTTMMDDDDDKGSSHSSPKPPSNRNEALLRQKVAATGSTSSSSRRRTMSAARSVSWKAGAVIEEKILESNPILEAFGNARTIRNDNSSRFGKFIELQFKHTGSLIGASIETYLLERVRLVHTCPEERTFHVFYELLAAATPQERTMLSLKDWTARDFKMTSASDCYDRRDGVNDAQLFDKLVMAMRTLGFDEDMQLDIFGVTVAFLHASNLTFLAVTDDSSKVDESNPHLPPFLELLGIDKDAFESALCEYTIEARNTSYTRQVNKDLAEKGLEALVKATYGAMFSYIVQSINRKVDYRQQTHKVHGPTTAAFIGVLDIFGFESFPINSFEQLCINYCNEALQQQFNLFVFKKEQEEYRHEGIKWDFIEFPDNQDVIDLIDQKRTGIISILTDQCRAPRGTDASFRDVMYKECDGHVRFEASALQRGHKQFSILHYAGPVTYDTEGFVEKNKDEIPRGASKLLQSSSNEFVQFLGTLVEAPAVATTSSSDALRASARTKRPTVGSQFKTQLDELRSRIDLTVPHYIRCLKPNQTMNPNEFDKGMIADQLRNAGVLEAIRVSRVGYSQRFDHQLFRDRYRVISVDSANESVEILSEAIAESIWTEQNPDEPIPEDVLNAVGIQIGTHKVFLREPAYLALERIRSEQLGLCATIVQTTARRFIARKRYSRIHETITALQALVRGFLAKKQWKQQQKSAIVIQCMYRNDAARSELATRKEAQRVREVEEQQRMAAIVAKQKAALEREQQTQKAAPTEDGMASVPSELERLKAELETSRREAAEAKAHVAKLKAENENLKQQLGKSRTPTNNNVLLRTSHYADQPDLRDISQDMNSLVHQSRESIRDLETVAKALAKLR